MKRKTLTLVLCLLTVMSLVGVGFASWVISADFSASESGDIVVDTVNDLRYTLTIEPKKIGEATDSEKIIFTAPSGSATGWLTYDGTKGYEKLTATYTCTVTAKDKDFTFKTSDSKTVDNLYISVAFNAVANEGKNTDAYNKAKNANIFALLGGNGYKISNVIISDDNKSVTFDLKIGYEWGSVFAKGEEGQKVNVNPFEYYNSKTANEKCGAVTDTSLTDTSTWADHAYYYLDLLSQIETSMKYNVTVTVSKTNSTGSVQLVKNS